MHRRSLLSALWSSFLVGVAVVGGLVPSTVGAIEITSSPAIGVPSNGRDRSLTRLLEFSTDMPTRASLRVRGPGEAWTLTSNLMGTEHSIPLMGMTFSRDYVVDQVTLTAADGTSTTMDNSFTIRTPSPPPNLPTVDVRVSDPARMEPGITLFPAGGAYTLGVDSAGTSRLIYFGAAPEIHQLSNGWFLSRINHQIVEFNFRSIKRGWYATGDPPPPNGIFSSAVVPFEARNHHHDAFMIEENGNILTLAQGVRHVENFPLSDSDPNAETGPADLVYDEVVEIATDGTVVQRWDLTEILDPTRGGYGMFNSGGPGIPQEGRADWSHSNAVVHDPSDDSIIVSVRNQDAVIKFDRPTGDLKWILGPHEGWGPEFQEYLLEPVGDDFEWPYHTHSPEVLPNGNVLLFDNGNFRARPFDPPVPDSENYSRAVEFSIDEETMEVSEVWEYGRDAEEVMYSPIVSDADWQSETDNVLVTFGSPAYVNGEPQSPRVPRIVEVTRDGEVVFDLAVHGTSVVYRSERVPSLYGPGYSVTDIPVLEGDFDGDGMVAQGDLNLVLLHWGERDSAPPMDWVNDLPLNRIDQGELNAVLLNWGNIATGAIANVPEPTALALLLVGLAALVSHSRTGRA